MSQGPNDGHDSRRGKDRSGGRSGPGGHRDPRSAPCGESDADRSRPAAQRPARPSRPQGDPHTWYRRGLDLLNGGNPAAAAQVLQHAATAEPAARSVREALARAQFDARRYDEAADNFRLIVEANPADDYAHFGLGLALARSGDPAAAAEHLALAAAMRPDEKPYTDALRAVRATLRAQSRGATDETGAAE